MRFMIGNLQLITRVKVGFSSNLSSIEEFEAQNLHSEDDDIAGRGDGKHEVGNVNQPRMSQRHVTSCQGLKNTNCAC